MVNKVKESCTTKFWCGNQLGQRNLFLYSFMLSNSVCNSRGLKTFDEQTSLSGFNSLFLFFICLSQFVIFKTLSYCFKETTGFDVIAWFASRPVLRLIRWYSKLGDITRILIKGYSVPQDFSWIENYKLLCLSLSFSLFLFLKRWKLLAALDSSGQLILVNFLTSGKFKWTILLRYWLETSLKF